MGRRSTFVLSKYRKLPRLDAMVEKKAVSEYEPLAFLTVCRLD